MPQDITDDKCYGYGLVPSHIKPLPKPMLTKFNVTTWHL